jgi:endogenous inhibitor of DNA gyrase (YacG/DUF329 family)
MSAEVKTTRIVSCPTCGGDSIYSPTNAYRPFCSARCKGIDLGAWASEDFKVPEDTPPDGLLPEDDRWMQ